MSVSPLPSESRRADWPRLVALKANDQERRINKLEIGSAVGAFLIDDGTATTTGGFSFNDGAA